VVRRRRTRSRLLFGAQGGDVTRRDAGQPLLSECWIQKLLHLPDVIVPSLLVLFGVRQVVLGGELGKGQVRPKPVEKGVAKTL